MAAVSSVPFARTVHRGLSGLEVGAYQRCLTRWNPKIRPYWESPGAPGGSGYFGAPMEAQVKRFQSAWSANRPRERPIPATGWIGPATHAALTHWADELAVRMLRSAHDQLFPPGQEKLADLVDHCRWCYLQRWSIHYTMGPARWADFGGLPAHRLPQWRDCSSFASEMYAGAGLPDPSANGYRGGYTGTMTGHGRPVALATAPVGALVFYGGTWAVPEHVAIHAGHQLVYSHGSEGGPYFLSATYRGDLTQVRAYA